MALHVYSIRLIRQQFFQTFSLISDPTTGGCRFPALGLTVHEVLAREGQPRPVFGGAVLPRTFKDTGIVR